MKYKFVIDLNERGYFQAHVEDEEGKDIINFSNEEDGSFYMIEDGFMADIEDMIGLKEYLIFCQLIYKDDEVIYMG
jgi:capsule polysaccharide export protein KpsC/LpsZ